jgi:single-strand DNA-binding protein
MNDNQLTLAGNIVRNPALTVTSSGRSRVVFRFASTPRRFDSAKQEWVNGETLFLDVTCWHRLAEQVDASLRGGDPVVVTGRLRQRSYEVEGQRRTVYEIDAQHVSPDLNRTGVTLIRAPRRPRDLDFEDTAAEASVVEPEASSGPLVPVASEAAA